MRLSGPDDGEDNDQDDLEAEQEEKGFPVRAQEPVFLMNRGDTDLADPGDFRNEVDV